MKRSTSQTKMQTPKSKDQVEDEATSRASAVLLQILQSMGLTATARTLCEELQLQASSNAVEYCSSRSSSHEASEEAALNPTLGVPAPNKVSTTVAVKLPSFASPTESPPLPRVRKGCQKTTTEAAHFSAIKTLASLACSPLLPNEAAPVPTTTATASSVGSIQKAFHLHTSLQLRQTYIALKVDEKDWETAFSELRRLTPSSGSSSFAADASEVEDGDPHHFEHLRLLYTQALWWQLNITELVFRQEMSLLDTKVANGSSTTQSPENGLLHSISAPSQPLLMSSVSLQLSDQLILATQHLITVLQQLHMEADRCLLCTGDGDLQKNADPAVSSDAFCTYIQKHSKLWLAKVETVLKWLMQRRVELQQLSSTTTTTVSYTTEKPRNAGWDGNGEGNGIDAALPPATLHASSETQHKRVCVEKTSSPTAAQNIGSSRDVEFPVETSFLAPMRRIVYARSSIRVEGSVDHSIPSLVANAEAKQKQQQEQEHYQSCVIEDPLPETSPVRMAMVIQRVKTVLLLLRSTVAPERAAPARTDPPNRSISCEQWNDLLQSQFLIACATLLRGGDNGTPFEGVCRRVDGVRKRNSQASSRSSSMNADGWAPLTFSSSFVALANILEDCARRMLLDESSSSCKKGEEGGHANYAAGTSLALLGYHPSLSSWTRSTSDATLDEFTLRLLSSSSLLRGTARNSLSSSYLSKLLHAALVNSANPALVRDAVLQQKSSTGAQRQQLMEHYERLLYTIATGRYRLTPLRDTTREEKEPYASYRAQAAQLRHLLSYGRELLDLYRIRSETEWVSHTALSMGYSAAQTTDLARQLSLLTQLISLQSRHASKGFLDCSTLPVVSLWKGSAAATRAKEGSRGNVSGASSPYSSPVEAPTPFPPPSHTAAVNAHRSRLGEGQQQDVHEAVAVEGRGELRSVSDEEEEEEEEEEDEQEMASNGSDASFASTADMDYNREEDAVREQVECVQASADGRLLAYLTARGALTVFLLHNSAGDSVEGAKIEYDERLLLHTVLPNVSEGVKWYESYSAILQFSPCNRFIMASVQYQRVDQAEQDGVGHLTSKMPKSTGEVSIYSLHRDASVSTRGLCRGEDTNHYATFTIHRMPCTMARWVDPRWWGGGSRSRWGNSALSWKMIAWDAVLGGTLYRCPSHFEPADGNDKSLREGWYVAARALLADYQCLSIGLDDVVLRWLPASGYILQRIHTQPLQDIIVCPLMSAFYVIDDAGEVFLYSAWNEEDGEHGIQDPKQSYKYTVGANGMPPHPLLRQQIAAGAIAPASATDGERDEQQRIPSQFFGGARTIHFRRVADATTSSSFLQDYAADGGEPPVGRGSHSEVGQHRKFYATGLPQHLSWLLPQNWGGTRSRSAWGARLGRRLIAGVLQLSSSTASTAKGGDALKESAGSADESITTHDDILRPVTYPASSRIQLDAIGGAIRGVAGMKVEIEDPEKGPAGALYHLLSMTLSGEPVWREECSAPVYFQNEEEDGEGSEAPSVKYAALEWWPSTAVARIHQWKRMLQRRSFEAQRGGDGQKDDKAESISRVDLEKWESMVLQTSYYADPLVGSDTAAALSTTEILTWRGFLELAEVWQPPSRPPSLPLTASNGRYLCIMASVGPYRYITSVREPLKAVPGFYACVVFDVYTNVVLRVLPICPVKPQPSTNASLYVPMSHGVNQKMPIFKLQCAATVLALNRRSSRDATKENSANGYCSTREHHPSADHRCNAQHGSISPDHEEVMLVLTIGGLSETLYVFDGLTGVQLAVSHCDAASVQKPAGVLEGESAQTAAPPPLSSVPRASTAGNPSHLLSRSVDAILSSVMKWGGSDVVDVNGATAQQQPHKSTSVSQNPLIGSSGSTDPPDEFCWSWLLQEDEDDDDDTLNDGVDASWKQQRRALRDWGGISQDVRDRAATATMGFSFATLSDTPNGCTVEPLEPSPFESLQVSVPSSLCATVVGRQRVLKHVHRQFGAGVCWQAYIDLFSCLSTPPSSALNLLRQANMVESKHNKQGRWSTAAPLDESKALENRCPFSFVNLDLHDVSQGRFITSIYACAYDENPTTEAAANPKSNFVNLPVAPLRNPSAPQRRHEDGRHGLQSAKISVSNLFQKTLLSVVHRIKPSLPEEAMRSHDDSVPLQPIHGGQQRATDSQASGAATASPPRRTVLPLSPGHHQNQMECGVVNGVASWSDADGGFYIVAGTECGRLCIAGGRIGDADDCPARKDDAVSPS